MLDCEFYVVPLNSLSESQKEAYRKLSIEPAHFLLDHPNSHLAIEARQKNELVGLILVEMKEWRVQMRSLFVREDVRRQGIGTALFGFFQNEMIKKKMKAIEFEYEQSSFFAPIIEKLIAHYQWKPGSYYLIRCFFDVPKYNAPWFQKTYKLPTDATIFPLNKLTKEDRHFIQHWQDQGRFMAYLSPFYEPDKIEPLNSLGLRYKGKIAGWCITHRYKPDCVRYFALFTNPDMPITGLSIYLLKESIRLQQASSIRWGVFEANLGYIDSSWKHFIKKRLLPYACKVERMKWAAKVFS